MAQFDVFRNPNPDSRESIPYLLDVQNELLDALSSRVVVPLIKHSIMTRPAQILNPVFEIEGEKVVMSTAELAGVPLKALGERVVSLSAQRDAIVAALNFLVTGI